MSDNIDDLFDNDSEVAILSILMKNPELNFSISDISPPWFSSTQHKIIFDAITDMVVLNLTPEPSFLVSYLKNNGLLTKAGGEEYISYISNQTYDPTNLIGYVSILDRAYKARTLLTVSAKIPNMISKAPDIDDIIQSLRGTLDNLSITGNAEKTELLGDSLPQSWDIIAERVANPVKHDITTGYNRIDTITGGFRGGALWFIAGRPSHGKTAWMISSAVSLGKAGIPCLIFELEMDRQSLVERVLSIVSGVPALNIRLGKLSNSEVERVKEAIKEVKNYPIYIDTNFYGNMSYVSSVIRRYKHIYDIKVVFIDYIQLLADRGTDATNELGRISKTGKLLANDLNLAFVILSQVNRLSTTRDDKRPVLSDLRQSGNLEEDADIVAMIYRDELDNKVDSSNRGILEFIIRKHRNGPIGTIDLKFDEETISIND